jgi:hypothetical protein
MNKKTGLLLTVITVIVMLSAMGRTGVYGALAKPEIVLTNYSISENYVFGEETFITVSFKNMHTEVPCNAVLISYSSANQSVIPSLGTSNQLFIDSLEAGKEQKIKIPVVIIDKGDGYASMSFNIEYTVEEAGVFNTSCYIVFPVGDESVSVRNVNVTTETTVGASSLVSVSFENLLKSDITNVKLMISGDLDDGEASYLIGSVTAWATKYAENYLSFNTPGQKKIKLQLVYSLENGEVKTKDIGEYTINVKEGQNQGGSTTPGDPGTETPKRGFMNPSTILLGLAGALLIAAVAIFVVTKVRNRN